MPRTFQSYFQSSSGGGAHRNYQAVALEGDALKHWYRDNADASNWKPAQTIVPSGAVHAGAIIQSSRGNSNIEVVVPCLEPGGGHTSFEVLVEECARSRTSYWRSNEEVTMYWQRAGAFYVEEPIPPPNLELRQTKWLEQVTGQVDRSAPAGSLVGDQYSRATKNAAACLLSQPGALGRGASTLAALPEGHRGFGGVSPMHTVTGQGETLSPCYFLASADPAPSRADVCVRAPTLRSSDMDLRPIQEALPRSCKR